MKKDLLYSVSRKLNTVGFKFKKNSPTIFVTLGVVGTVASAVMACVATTKLNSVIDDTKQKIGEAKKTYEESPVYSEQDLNKDIKIIYAHTGLELVKLYGPSIILGSLSLTSIIYSHSSLMNRNASLAAAYSVLNKGFKEYRNRVVEEYGEDVDKALRYGLKEKEESVIVVDEDGTQTEVKETKTTIPGTVEASSYSKFFDSSSPYWEDNPEYNFTFLKSQERYANQKLKTKKYLFLNEVYQMLGLKETKAGQIVGWVYDEDNPVGDNFVDFGICNFNIEKNRDFVNGYEPVILLDFNVDGNIWDLMEKY